MDFEAGVTQRDEIVDSGNPPLTVYTMSMWVKFLDASTPCSIILRTDGSGNELYSWSDQIRLNQNGQFEIFVYDGLGNVLSGTSVVRPGVWYHVAATVESFGMMHLYVNGKEEGTAKSVGAIWTGGDRFIVGPASGNGFTRFIGEVDELGICGPFDQCSPRPKHGDKTVGSGWWHDPAVGQSAVDRLWHVERCERSKLNSSG